MIVSNVNDGVDVAYGANVTNLTVKNTTIHNDGTYSYGYGVYFGYNDSGLLLQNDQVYNIAGTGVFLNGSGNETVQGGAYYDNLGTGIDNNSSSGLIEGAAAFGNNSGNGADGIYSGGGTVTANTVFGNGSTGISANGLISDNVVYDQNNTSGEAIDVGSNSTAAGNTVYGSVSGLLLNGNAVAQDNLAYDNTGSAIYYPGTDPAAVSGNTLYGNAIGISGAEYTSSGTIYITGNLIYQNKTAGILLAGGTLQDVSNNTIDETVGTAISVVPGSLSAGYYGNPYVAMIENNILAVAAGPALSVAPSAEIGFVSNYNLFDLTGSGAIASWEGVSYATLAPWYYATGLDQLSQLANPEFVNPAGANGILGFEPLTGTPQAVTASSTSGFSTTGTWTSFQNGNSSNAADGGAGTIALESLAGSGGTATFTLNGLTPGVIYQVAVNWPGNFVAGDATYTVRDANGVALATGYLDQYHGASTGITVGGAGYTVIGQMTATTTSISVTLSGGSGNTVLADGVLVQQVGINEGADDNFHVQPGSPAIDAGNPTTVFNLEPGPNGGRVNLGFDGDTPQAQTSGATRTLQVLNPAQFGKYEVGEQVPISIVSSNLAQTQAVLLINAGGGAIDTPTQGNWQANTDAAGAAPYTFTNTSAVTNTTGVPTALFATGVDVSSNTGTSLSYDLPVANGAYTLRLFFADPNTSTAGYRLFNVVVNGVTLVTNYDIAKAAGGENIAVELDLTVTAAGGTGINLSLVSQGGDYGAMINAIEVDQAVPGGTVAPTANIQVSTNNGASWAILATNVPINRFGQAQYIWTVDRTTTGSTALIRATSGTLTATSQPFLLANGGTNFYINDSLHHRRSIHHRHRQRREFRQVARPADGQPRRPAARLSDRCG